MIASGVVDGSAGDDDGMVEGGDAVPHGVLVQVGHGCAGEGLEDGGVDVDRAPGWVARGHSVVRDGDKVVDVVMDGGEEVGGEGRVGEHGGRVVSERVDKGPLHCRV